MGFLIDLSCTQMETVLWPSLIAFTIKYDHRLASFMLRGSQACIRPTLGVTFEFRVSAYHIA